MHSITHWNLHVFSQPIRTRLPTPCVLRIMKCSASLKFPSSSVQWWQNQLTNVTSPQMESPHQASSCTSRPGLITATNGHLFYYKYHTETIQKPFSNSTLAMDHFQLCDMSLLCDESQPELEIWRRDHRFIWPTSTAWCLSYDSLRSFTNRQGRQSLVCLCNIADLWPATETSCLDCSHSWQTKGFNFRFAYFLIPKNTGGFRPILDLHIVKQCMAQRCSAW